MITLNFEKAFWPIASELIHLGGSAVPLSNVSIGGVDHQLALHIVGDLLVFRRPGYSATVYLDIKECLTRPVISLDRTGGQLTVYCEFFIPRLYDPPILEFRLATADPLVFGESDWPIWSAHFILVTTVGRFGQNLWVRTPVLPVTVKTYWNASANFEPSARGYLSELTIVADLPEVALIGQLQTQASDVHFDTHIRDSPVTLTIEDFLEYGALDANIFPHIRSPNMHVQFLFHEKHESLDSPSKFGGAGTWEWINFPHTHSATGIGHLRLFSGDTYNIFYGHTWSGSYGSALSALPPLDGASSIVFSDPSNPSVTFCPNYYYNEATRPSDAWLEAHWPSDAALSDSPAVLYFANASVPADAHFDVLTPEFGPPGFEPSTFFFDFVWDFPNRALRMIRKPGTRVSDFNYRFCWNPANASGVCPPDHAVLKSVDGFTNFVLPIARTLRIALAADLAYDFAYFTAPQISIRVSGGYRLTVPPSFLAGAPFTQIELRDVMLAFSSSDAALGGPALLDLQNVTFDDSVIAALGAGGCRDTAIVQSDFASYAPLREICVPDVLFLEGGAYKRLLFADGFVAVDSVVTVAAVGERPFQIELVPDAAQLQFDIAPNTTSVLRTYVWMAAAAEIPRFEFGDGWTPATAANLTIDNLVGQFIVRTPFVPFRPGAVARAPGISIAAPAEPPGGIRIFFPFPPGAVVNAEAGAAALRFEGIEMTEPATPSGSIGKAVFAGDLHFRSAAGITVTELAFDPKNRPTIDVEFRLQGGLPRLQFGVSRSPAEIPRAVNLVHRGESERAFVAKYTEWFRYFSHEIICGTASLPCEHWPVVFKRNETEDRTTDHVGASSIVRAVCRPQRRGLGGKCLALEIEEYYFPLATQSPWPSLRVAPTASHHRPTAGDESPTPEYTENSGFAKGIVIGMGGGVVIIAAAVFVACRCFRPQVRDDYQPAEAA
jgi:hypothetical protein